MTGGKHWLKSLKTIIDGSFKKIRILNTNQDKYVQSLLSDRLHDPSNSDIEKEITEKITQRNINLILEQVSGMADTSGNLSRLKIWKIKQRICPKYEMNVPVAKKDKHGNVVCNKTELNTPYVNVYQDRLRHRSISDEYLQLKENKEYLFSIRLELAKTRKSKKWTNDDLLKVMKQLKTKKKPQIQ